MYTLARKEGLLTTRPEFPVITMDNARQGFLERAYFENARGASFGDREKYRPVRLPHRLAGQSEILPLTCDRVDFAAVAMQLCGHKTRKISTATRS